MACKAGEVSLQRCPELPRPVGAPCQACESFAVRHRGLGSER
jgi:hypothetical protein